MHSILLPAAVALLFLEALIQTGGAIQRLVRDGDWSDCKLQPFLARFVIGAASWLVGALILSAFELGTIPHLRYFTIALALVSVAAARGKPISLAMLRRFEQLSSKDRILVLFLLVLILTQFGKANYGTDYDSTWYGLRPERVLVGPDSLFDDLKLVHYVYYYPKHFEALTLPLASLNKGTFIIAFNVILLGLSFLAVFQLGRELDFDRTGALLITALAGSLPAFSNMASTAKTDTMMSLYAFVSVLFLWKWCKEQRAIDFSYGLAALLGMAGTKINAYAYAPLLGIGFLVVGLWLRHTNEQKIQSGGAAQPAIRSQGATWKTASFVIPGIAACAFGGLAMRTWVLTGVPTMPAFVDIWNRLGLSRKYPWNNSEFGFIWAPIGSLSEMVDHWYRLLFDPQQYPHYVMAWPGNVGFFSACAIVILFIVGAVSRKRQIAFLSACLPLMLGGIATACLIRRHAEGGTDGNYYVVPIVLTVLSVAGILAGAGGKIRAVMVTCCVGFILLHLPVMFVSHWSWHPGTQAFSLALDETLFDADAAAEERLKKAGAWEIEEYLRRYPHAGLCVGFSNGEESALHRLSCTHEDFEQIGAQFWPLFSSESSFKQYLAWARPDLFIIPKSLSFHASRLGTAVRIVFDELAANPDVVKIDSANYSALDLSRLRLSPQR